MCDLFEADCTRWCSMTSLGLGEDVRRRSRENKLMEANKLAPDLPSNLKSFHRRRERLKKISNVDNVFFHHIHIPRHCLTKLKIYVREPG